MYKAVANIADRISIESDPFGFDTEDVSITTVG